MMKYVSTRGKLKEASFEQAVLSGYCSDKGLFMPSNIPKVESAKLETWATLTYIELTKQILPLFIAPKEIATETLCGLIDNAFCRFPNAQPVKLRKLKNDLNVLELFHGPTLAFKDLGLSCVAQLIKYFLSKNRAHSTILVGTSGDTGGAAIEAVRGLSCIDIIVLLPRGRCTSIQELQMTTVIEDNVHVYSVDGTSDELDEPIRKCFDNPEFVANHRLCSVNSINWGRILVQIVHFFYAYLQVCPACDEELEIVVPTGAAGNITAGCIAQSMGLPIRLVATVSSNLCFTRMINTGVYSIDSSFQTSLAPAMDIQNAYNIERLLWLFSNGDSQLVCRLLDEFTANKQVTLPDTLHNQMHEAIIAHHATDVSILRAMSQCWKDNEYLICPHTATAVDYYYRKEAFKSRKIVCLATASPAKFENAVAAARLPFEKTEALEKLFLMPTNSEKMNHGDNWHQILKECIIEISRKRNI